jgi:stress-induced-phosphoprotein 1
MSAQEWKDKGNTFIKNKHYEEALNCYNEAIKADPKDHIHYSNRSACYINLNNFQKALEDAEQCIKIKPDWAKGYLRKGMAEFKLDKLEEAAETYKKGLEIDPNNTEIKKAFEELERSANPFTQNYQKLFTDPRTSRYMSDPQFNNLLQFAMKDQKMLMELVRTDPRFVDVFSVLTGIDLTQMAESQEKLKKDAGQKEKERKKREEEDRAKAEEEQKKREEEERWASMSNEEKDLELRKKKAEELKAQANEFFKAKNWSQALDLYTQALELNPQDVTYHLNRAGVYHELKDYNKVIEECNKVIDNTYDFQKRARAFGRIAYAYQEMGDLDQAIQYFEKSLLEVADHRIKDALRAAQNLKKKLEAERYLNPELAEEHNTKGNELYKAGKYPQALEEYNEAIRRNPNNAKMYSNRAACYIKLMEFNQASNDCTKALELDPNFLRAFQRKATCHIMMKEYHRAMDTYEKGLKLFPDDKELKDGYMKCISQINSGNSQDDEERVKHAYADPEIQRLLKDPRIQQLFKDLQENPNSAQNAIQKDEFISGAFKKLVAAGIIKTK